MWPKIWKWAFEWVYIYQLLLHSLNYMVGGYITDWDCYNLCNSTCTCVVVSYSTDWSNCKVIIAPRLLPQSYTLTHISLVCSSQFKLDSRYCFEFNTACCSSNFWNCIKLEFNTACCSSNFWNCIKLDNKPNQQPKLYVRITYLWYSTPMYPLNLIRALPTGFKEGDMIFTIHLHHDTKICLHLATNTATKTTTKTKT